MPSRKRSARTWIARFLLTLMLYVLSSGPVYRLTWWLIERGYNPEKVGSVFPIIYSPISWICKHSEIADHAWRWYINQWDPILKNN